ncbi:hypothetical protein FAF44_43380 [Nonomuraea sp. MG754425]|uniref:alpha/beta hydrolase n=1 Tax=Nonomuraea sp. MG754425 TaxID=2570319 RepID=UPI001F3ED085|nr:alpha/beta hydrolase [Nonomuraea sp. MG754425]MCF6475168.1 hypothetical protein [Nonomuraea sp. MG754425]
MLRYLAVASAVALGALLMWPAPPTGRLVRVYGADPASADRVAVVVPGADTTVATFESSTRNPGGAARALVAEAARLAPGERLAVVAWLGYDSPPTLSFDVLTDEAAVAGSRELRRAVSALRHRTAAPIALLCHSYGSYICAQAAPGLPVAALAFIGSPGVGAGPAVPATRARVWAGLGDNDWVRLVPKIKLGAFGFGSDPMSGDYGARRFEAGAGGHSDYYRPGSISLSNLALIALGHDSEVTLESETPTRTARS